MNSINSAKFHHILESFEGGWISNYVNDKFDKNQFGALQLRSTTLTLVSVLHHWLNALNNDNSVQSLFVD